MSSSAIKGLEVLVIAGVVFWFAYSQLKGLNRTKEPAARNEAAGRARTEDRATEGDDPKRDER